MSHSQDMYKLNKSKVQNENECLFCSLFFWRTVRMSKKALKNKKTEGN